MVRHNQLSRARRARRLARKATRSGTRLLRPRDAKAPGMPAYAIVARDEHTIHFRLPDPTKPKPDKYADELLDSYLFIEAPYNPKHTMLDPTASAMNCCPPTVKVIGEVLMMPFNGMRHNVLPSRSSTATKYPLASP